MLKDNHKSILKETKRKNNKILKWGITFLLLLLIFLGVMYGTNNFAKQTNILTIDENNYVVKQSFMGYGKEFYFFNDKGVKVLTTKDDGTGIMVIHAEDLVDEKFSSL